MGETYPNTTIRPYRPGDEAAILATFNVVFREVCGAAYVDRDLATWRWEFGQSPAGTRISLAVADDGTVAAQYAGVPLRMHTAFGDAVFVHIVDSFVHPEYRKGLKKPGLFVETALPWFEDCRANGDAVLYGYPVATAERIGQRYLEYKRLRVVDYLCRDVEQAARAPGEIAWERHERIPDDLGPLEEACAQQKKCLVRRDRRYLDWRYVRHPERPYELWVARRGGSPCGLLVLRGVHELVPNACTIADWLAHEQDEVTHDAFVAKACERARVLGRKTLLAVFADTSREHAALRGRGFAVVPSGNYLERRLTHRIYHPQMTTEWLAEHWWYTLGDSDLV